MRNKNIFSKAIISIIVFCLFFVVLLVALLVALVGSYSTVEIIFGKVNVTLAQNNNRLKYETNQFVQKNSARKLKLKKL